MSLIPGNLYIILSGTDKGITIHPTEPRDGSSRPLAIVATKTDSQPKWRLAAVGEPGSNEYSFTLAGEDSYALVVDKGLLWISTVIPATPFSLETGGNGKRRFHIPAENKVLKYDGEGKQVLTAKEDGSDEELWFIDEWHHAGGGP